MKRFWWSRPSTFFLDYLVIRQCQDDFKPHRIREAIKDFSCIVIVLDPHVSKKKPSYGPEATERVWCGFEMFCAVAEHANICGVYTWGGWLSHDPDRTLEVRIEDAKASKDQDKEELKQLLLAENLSFEELNSKIKEGIEKAARVANQGVSMTVIGFSIVAICLIEGLMGLLGAS